jgi:hypothetical protein
MCLEGIAKRSRNDPDGRKGFVVGHRNMAEEFLLRIAGQFSSGGGRSVQESMEDNGRRSVGMDGGENRFLGGSDPTLRGLQPPNALRRRGSLPPKLFSRTNGSVAG